MRRWLGSIGAAFGFLTRFKVAAAGSDDLGASLLWFPLVGTVLGGLLYGVAVALAGQLAPGLLAVALVALHALATGGLHLDGLADTFDALGGGRGDRQRMLDIMRDSRIGAHGAAALALLLIGKVLALSHLATRGTLWPLVAAPAFARWAAAALVVLFPYARPDGGLGSAFHQDRHGLRVAGATLLLAPLLFACGAGALYAGGMALMAAFLLANRMNRQLGGLTGDVYGAAIEIGELVFWASAG